MKKLFLFLLCFTAAYTYANRATYEKLLEVNHCWKARYDVRVRELPAFDYRTEKNWISLHLSLVESALRERSLGELNPDQQQKRLHCLDLLHGYGLEGKFPVNKAYTRRMPIFIDQEDNFCAVGFLLRMTGYEHVSRMIAAKANLAYVEEMAFPELAAWASEFGFSVGELAWIQPTYSPETSFASIGNGVDGMVQELFVDEAAALLYVGGSFKQADKKLTANNIAYVTEDGGVYSWHTMGTGVDGTVHAITKYGDKIFAGGSFVTAGGIAVDNVAYWSAGSWHKAGCLKGTVKDLIVFEDQLYASGMFSNCADDTARNFAQWNGTDWLLINGLEGHINIMKEAGGYLVLGGAFGYDTLQTVNAIQWNTRSSFQLFDNTVLNEVMELELFKDTLYAACKATSATDSDLLKRISDGIWISAVNRTRSYGFFDRLYDSTDTMAFYTLCSDASLLNIGGSFRYNPWIGIPGMNCYAIGKSADWLLVDSAVQKMVLFKKELIIGGSFKNGYTGGVGGSFKEVNGIAKKLSIPSSIPIVEKNNPTVNIYPNPAVAGTALSLEGDFGVARYELRHITGKLYAEGIFNANAAIQLPEMPAGMYLITLMDKTDRKATRKLVIR